MSTVKISRVRLASALALLLLPVISSPAQDPMISVSRQSDDPARDWKTAGSATHELVVYEKLSPYAADLVVTSTTSPETGVLLPLLESVPRASNSYGLVSVWCEGQRAILLPIASAGDYNLVQLRIANLDPSKVISRPRVRQSVVASTDDWEGDAAFDSTGNRAAFVRASDDGAVLVVSNVTGRPREIILPNFDGMCFAPDFTPDGRTIGYSVRQDEEDMIVVLDPDEFQAGSVGRYRHYPGLTYPSFVAEDRLVCYSGSDLHILNLETGLSSLLAADVHVEEKPAVSPSGRWVAYTTPEDVGRSIVILRLSDGARFAVEAGLPISERPVWLQSDDQLVFQGYDGLQWDLYLATIDGGGGAP